LVEHLPVPGGYLRQVYGSDGVIANIRAVRTRDGEAVGMQLYVLSEDLITFKSECGLSGHSFNHGVVTVGTVYDDDGPPDPGRTVDKREWLNECVATMVAGLTKPG
jgi:hypothetical protein